MNIRLVTTAVAAAAFAVASFAAVSPSHAQAALSPNAKKLKDELVGKSGFAAACEKNETSAYVTGAIQSIAKREKGASIPQADVGAAVQAACAEAKK